MTLNWKYIGRRFGQMLLTLWIIATILFFVFRLMPGNPLTAYIDPNFTKEQQEILLEQFGLDKPLFQQYLVFLLNLLQGNLGTSFVYRDDVLRVVARVLPNTLYLMLFSLIIAYVVGVLGGILLAWLRGKKGETVGIILTLLTRSAPQFWVSMLVLAIFSFRLGWLPSSGTGPAGVTYASEWAKFTSPVFWKYMLLPSLTLAIYLLGLPLLLMRTNMVETMEESYVTIARMRGLSERRVMLKYAARNAILPVVTAMAVGLPQVHPISGWPKRRLLVDAVTMSDYPLAQGAFLLAAAIMVFMNFVADLLYSVLDPRITVEDMG